MCIYNIPNIRKKAENKINTNGLDDAVDKPNEWYYGIITCLPLFSFKSHLNTKVPTFFLFFLMKDLMDFTESKIENNRNPM